MRVLVLALLGGCVTVSDQYNCTPGDNAACVSVDGTQGHCQLTGNCSFPDSSCGAGGDRYDSTAAPDRVGICELTTNGPSMTAAQPIVGGLPFEITFASPQVPQMLVIDTAGANTMAQDLSLSWFAGSCPPSTGPQPVGQQTCSSPGNVRISVGVSSSGAYCVVVGATSGVLSLRVFPQASDSTPGC